MNLQTFVRLVARVVLGGFLLFTGTAHFTSTEAFKAQVPPFLPWPEMIIQVSGVMELLLGLGLLFAPARYRSRVGWITAAFFVAIFPGNLSQYFTHTSQFSLDSDTARAVRLLFQPVLVVWGLWCTGALKEWRNRR